MPNPIPHPPPPPPNTGVAAFPSGPSASLLWSRPGRLSPGFVQQPFRLLSASSHLPSGSSRTIFLKWKAGRVYLTHPDCTQRQAHTPSPAAGKACHHLVTAPAPSPSSSLSAPLPPTRLGSWMCLGLPQSLCTHPLCSWPRIPFSPLPPPPLLSNTLLSLRCQFGHHLLPEPSLATTPQRWAMLSSHSPVAAAIPPHCHCLFTRLPAH